jgi:hypothetical protein
LDSVDSAADARTKVTFIGRLACTAIALAAAWGAIDGLRHLEYLDAARAAQTRNSWQPTVEPSLIFFAACILLLALLSLTLAWYARPGKSATRLSFFAALVALGYAMVFNGDVFTELILPAIDWVIKSVAQPWKLIAVRIGVALNSVFLFPVWTIAGALLLRFLTEFPPLAHVATDLPQSSNSGAASERVSILTALMVGSGLFVAALPTNTPVVWLWANGVGTGVVLVWLVFRHLKIRAAGTRGEVGRNAVSSSERALLVAVLALLGLALLCIVDGGTDPGTAAVIHLSALGVAAVCFLLTLPRGLSLMPWCAYVPATVLSVVYMVLRQYSYKPGMETRGELHIYPWLFVCSVLGLRLAISRLTTLETKAREQALIVLSGISLACFFSLAWGLASVIYITSCNFRVSGVFCTLARYKGWLYELPALTLVLFFALALLFPGEIDAAKLFRRTTLYGALGWLLIFGFAAIEHLLDDVFGHLLSDEAPRVIAAGAIGMAVHPVKRRLEDGVDTLLKKVLGTARELS